VGFTEQKYILFKYPNFAQFLPQCEYRLKQEPLTEGKAQHNNTNQSFIKLKILYTFLQNKRP
jgi:hypothetical protein